MAADSLLGNSDLKYGKYGMRSWPWGMNYNTQDISTVYLAFEEMSKRNNHNA